MSEMSDIETFLGPWQCSVRKSLAKYLTEMPNNEGRMVSVLVLRTVLIPSSAWS